MKIKGRTRKSTPRLTLALVLVVALQPIARPNICNTGFWTVIFSLWDIDIIHSRLCKLSRVSIGDKIECIISAELCIRDIKNNQTIDLWHRFPAYHDSSDWRSTKIILKIIAVQA